MPKQSSSYIQEKQAPSKTLSLNFWPKFQIPRLGPNVTDLCSKIYISSLPLKVIFRSRRLNQYVNPILPLSALL